MEISRSRLAPARSSFRWLRSEKEISSLDLAPFPKRRGLRDPTKLKDPKELIVSETSPSRLAPAPSSFRWLSAPGHTDPFNASAEAACTPKDVTIANRCGRHRPPIIVIRNSWKKDFKNKCSLLTEKLKGDYRVKIAGHDHLILYTETEEDWLEAQNVLREEKEPYHTHAPAQNRTNKLIIKRIHAAISEAEIKSELAKQGLRPQAVVRLRAGGPEKKMLDVCLVTVPKDITVAKARSVVREVLKCSVTWDKYDRKGQAVQCWRCQSYNHVAKYCNYEPRCVKCAETHHTADCPQNAMMREQRPPPKCVNCAEQHPANHRGCKSYKEVVKALQRARARSEGHSRGGKQTAAAAGAEGGQGSAAAITTTTHRTEQETPSPGAESKRQSTRAAVVKTGCEVAKDVVETEREQEATDGRFSRLLQPQPTERRAGLLASVVDPRGGRGHLKDVSLTDPLADATVFYFGRGPETGKIASAKSPTNGVLEAVFRHLSPEVLLGAVPLVCKRWCDVARRKGSWREAVVEYKPGNEVAVARVVRLAPALGSLVLEQLCMVGVKSAVSTEMQIMIDSLLQGVSDVRHVAMPTRYVIPSVYLKLLVKYKDAVARLGTHVSKWMVDTRLEVDGHPVGALDIINGMPRLQSLHLIYDGISEYVLGVHSPWDEGVSSVSGLPYSGQLGRGLTTLRRLRVSGNRTLPLEDDLVRSVTLDVLRAHGSRLTHLNIELREMACLRDRSSGLDMVLEEIRHCQNLTSISLPMKHVSVVRDMRHLHCLALCSGITFSLEDETGCADFIRSSPVVANLKFVILNYDLFCCPYIIKAISAACRKHKSLTIENYYREYEGNYRKSLGQLLISLPRLEVIYLQNPLQTSSVYIDLRPFHTTPSLKFLVIYSTNSTDQKENRPLREVVANLMRERPHFKIMVA